MKKFVLMSMFIVTVFTICEAQSQLEVLLQLITECARKCSLTGPKDVVCCSLGSTACCKNGELASLTNDPSPGKGGENYVNGKNVGVQGGTAANITDTNNGGKFEGNFGAVGNGHSNNQFVNNGLGGNSFGSNYGNMGNPPKQGKKPVVEDTTTSATTSA